MDMDLTLTVVQGTQSHSPPLAQVDGMVGLVILGNLQEDSLLFIQMKLCTLGSFGRFLWGYGRKFPRLDEAQVWKILES